MKKERENLKLFYYMNDQKQIKERRKMTIPSAMP
jgi:hypothetical protein